MWGHAVGVSLRKNLRAAVSYVVLTSEDWRLKQLYKFVNLCQELNSHLEIGTELWLRFIVLLCFVVYFMIMSASWTGSMYLSGCHCIV
jgi:hypothetical protein